MYKMVSVILATNLFLVFGQQNNKNLKNEVNLIQNKNNESSVVKIINQNEPNTYETGRNDLESPLFQSYEKKQKEEIDYNDPANIDKLRKIKEGHRDYILRSGTKEEVYKLSQIDQAERANIASRNTRDASTLFISEVAEGSSYNKYLEIFNGTGADVDLSGYSLSSCSNGCDVENQFDYPDNVTFDTGTILADGDVFIICDSRATDAINAECDQTFGFLSNGDDFMALTEAGATADTYIIVDKFGDFGPDPGSGFDIAGVSSGTKDNTLVRKESVTSGNTDWASSAGADTESSEWIVGDRPTADYTPSTLGSHTMVDEPAGYVESFEGSFPPYGWEMISMNTINSITQSSSSSYDGVYSARFSSYSSAADYTQYMISPKLSVGASGSFSFWHNQSSYSGESFMVGVSTTDTDPASFTFSPEVVRASGSSGTWEEYVEDLSAYANQEVYVAIKLTSSYLYYLYIDNVTSPPVWVDPNPIASVAPLSIDFGEIKISESKTVDLVISNPGGGDLTGSLSSDNSKFTIGAFSGTVVPGAQEVVALTYTPTEVADDTGVITFTSNDASGPVTVAVSGSGTDALLTEGFEGSFPPTGWTVISNNDINSVSQSTASLSGDYSLRFSSISSASDYTQYLISPVVSIPADGGSFSMFYQPYYSFSPESFMVGVSTTDTDPASFTWYDEVVSYTTAWSEHSEALSSYAGQDVYIAIKYTSIYAYYLYVDDIKVLPAPAVPVLTVGATSVPFIATGIDSINSVSVSIANVGSGDLSGTVTYPAGFTGPVSIDATTSELAIKFSPTSSGIHSGDVVITSNGGDAAISVSGSAGHSVATWEPAWPQGWETINNDGVGDGWQFYGPVGSRTGTGYTGTTEDGSGTVNDDWLISPKYSVASGDYFSFYSSMGFSAGGSYPDIMEVFLSPTGSGQPSDFTVRLDSVNSVGGDYLPYSYDLTAYVDTEVRLAIVYRGEWGYELNVDDVAGPEVVVEAGPVISQNPTGFSYGELAAGSSLSALFDFYNTGGADLEITEVSFNPAGVFSVGSTTTFPLVTAAGDSNGFYVVFSPTADEDSVYVSEMTIVSNTGSNLVIPVTGIGKGGYYWEGFSSGIPSNWYVSSDRWGVASIGGNNLAYHADDAVDCDDTLRTAAIALPEITDGGKWKLSFSDYQNYGSYYVYHEVGISTDGGATYTPVWLGDGVSNSLTPITAVDITSFAGGDIHIAFVYQGNYADIWGIDNVKIEKAYEPVLAMSNPVFPATAVGDTSTVQLVVGNVGSGVVNATMAFDGFVSTATTVSLEAGDLDTIDVHYIPTVSGISTGTITCDASTSVTGDGAAFNAGTFVLTPEANAGDLAFDFVNEWCGWDTYDLLGFEWQGYPGDWTWWGGAGHASANYAGVYSRIDYWGGADDYLVSPRLDVTAGEILSFWAKGGADANTGDRDSMDVWVSSERPVMGYEIDETGARVDTGFVNTDAFTWVYGSLPSPDSWDPVSIDLTNYAGDTWVLIHSMKNGWQLSIDDLAHPDIYMNPLPVLYVGRGYDFGVTQPTGDSVRYYLRNTGMSDLVIESMDWENGEFFSAQYDGTFPVTIQPGGIDSIMVHWMPEQEGFEYDTLFYVSNYTAGEFDAYGRGTEYSVFTADAFNNAPNATNLVAPAPDTELVIDGSNAEGTTQIIWQNATDPDGYPIEYILELIVENTSDTLDTMITTNIFNLSHAEILEYMEESGVTSLDITWDVYTSDGFEEVESGNGPWSLSIDGGWALGVDNNTIPDVFALHNNYPNPFNPITNIRYDIPEVSDVKIDIYNLAGKKVKTLVSSNHQPGRYKIQWNATNESGAPVSTGMYIYKIRAKDFVSVKKLLLMK